MPKAKVKKYEEVEFQIMNIDEVYVFNGALLIRSDEIVIDIEGSDGGTIYLIVGKPQKHFFEGANTAGPLMPKVRARWTNLGRVYVGYWIEDGHDYVFSFEMPKDSKD